MKLRTLKGVVFALPLTSLYDFFSGRGRVVLQFSIEKQLSETLRQTRGLRILLRGAGPPGVEKLASVSHSPLHPGLENLFREKGAQLSGLRNLLRGAALPKLRYSLQPRSPGLRNLFQRAAIPRVEKLAFGRRCLPG